MAVSPPGWWCAGFATPATRTRCFRCWRYHPFFTNSELPTAEADLTHRKHAIVETTFADLIDGPLAHLPSGLFAANCAWLACAVIAHNLLARRRHHRRRRARRRARCHPAPRPDQRARPLRRARPQADAAPTSALAMADRVENPVGQRHRLQSGDPTSRMNATSPAHPPSQARPRRHVESWCRPAEHSCPHHSEPPQSCRNQPRDATTSPIHGFRLRAIYSTPQDR